MNRRARDQGKTQSKGRGRASRGAFLLLLRVSLCCELGPQLVSLALRLLLLRLLLGVLLRCILNERRIKLH